jgi:carboxymethylenebutenolidase
MTDMSEAAGLHRYPLARRGLVMSGLISGFTLATTRVEAQVIHTDTEGLVAGETKIPTDNGDLPAYYARPAKGGAFPTVLVMEEIFGLHEHIRDLCRRLAKDGYLAVATEYYARIADLSKMTDVPTIMRDVIAKSSDGQMMHDMDATAAWAAKNKGSAAKLGVTGFCRNGRAAWLYAAHNPKLKAAVSWYGPVNTPDTDVQPKSPLDIAGELKCPLLGLYAGQDAGIKVDDVRAAQAKAKAAGKTVDVVVFPDAPHAFNADYRPSYRATDAKIAWQLMLTWFKTYGVA